MSMGTIGLITEDTVTGSIPGGDYLRGHYAEEATWLPTPVVQGMTADASDCSA